MEGVEPRRSIAQWHSPFHEEHGFLGTLLHIQLALFSKLSGSSLLRAIVAGLLGNTSGSYKRL